MMIGERDAFDFGVEVNKTRLAVFATSSLLVGTAVAASGSVGYVGLIVPHLVRLAIGSDNRLVIPFSAMAGAIFVVSGGHNRARGNRAARIARRRNYGVDRCADVYLFVEEELATKYRITRVIFIIFYSCYSCNSRQKKCLKFKIFQSITAFAQSCKIFHFRLQGGKNYCASRRERRGKNDAFEIFKRQFADCERRDFIERQNR